MTVFPVPQIKTPQTTALSATRRRIVSDCLVAVGILAIFGAMAYLAPKIAKPVGPQGIPSTVSTDLHELPYDALRSVLRMTVALAFSFIFAVLYGLAAARSRRAAYQKELCTTALFLKTPRPRLRYRPPGQGLFLPQAAQGAGIFAIRKNQPACLYPFPG